MIRLKFDGFPVGNKLLEDVNFLVVFDELTCKVASVEPWSVADDKYLDDLNKDKWIKAIEDFINDETNRVFDLSVKLDIDELKETLEDIGAVVL